MVRMKLVSGLRIPECGGAVGRMGFVRSSGVRAKMNWRLDLGRENERVSRMQYRRHGEFVFIYVVIYIEVLDTVKMHRPLAA
jgi:hypothetical protein